jgi:lipopolysaccharide transport system ATP-binding protein
MENAIEFNQVWKKYKRGEKLNSLRDTIPNLFRQIAQKEELKEQEFWVTKNVSFNIKKGEVVGIMGPNGAGKSTILKLLSRIIVPNRGSMSIQGRLSALIEVTAGFHGDLTGRENVYLNGTILGMKKKEIDERFDNIVEFSGISEFIDTPVKRYSSGMFSRLGFSVAAHMNPDVLLVDEVLSVGDISFQAKCSEKIRELLKTGATIVLVSHNLSLVQSLCKRIILLNKGEVLKDGPTDLVIPFYENLVFKKQEEDLQKKVSSSSDYKVKVKTEAAIELTQCRIANEKNEEKDVFQSSDDIHLRMDYNAAQKIDEPVFGVEIIRADGVICCVARTKDHGFSVGQVDGKGAIGVHLGRMNLGPGIYMLKLTVWDKDLIHPFTIRYNDVLRIEAEGCNIDSAAVFLPNAQWKRE